jgi:hypothetical protein
MEPAPMMTIRIVHAIGAYRRGEVLEAPEGQARLWIARGIAEEADTRPLLETATSEPEVERADATPRRKRKT